MSTLPIGRPFVDGGIEFQLVREQYAAIYPSPRVVVEFVAHPTADGRCAPAYRAQRRELGDDWSRSAGEPETLVAWLLAAGLSEAEAEAALNEAHAMRMAGYR